jgi:hypothetical protein
MIEVAVFAACGFTLRVGHSFADHLLQTDHQAEHKAGKGKQAWKALLGHVFSYHVLQIFMLLAVIALFNLPVTLLGFSLAVLFSAVTHGFIDKRWPIRKYLEATGSLQFAQMVTPINGMYVSDQAAHEGCLWISALFIALL